MKILFEEYGRTLLVAFAVLCVFAIFFVRYDGIHALGAIANVNTTISHSEGQNALRSVAGTGEGVREKPAVDFSRVNTHLYRNWVFKPLYGVVFYDANGFAVDNVVVTSILHCDADGNVTEFVDYYNETDDCVVLNTAHYSNAHATCTASEFAAAGGHLMIADTEDQNIPGAVTVTYMATDAEKQVTTQKLTFVVDGGVT